MTIELLLDTHALIWALSAPAKLSPRSRELIGQSSTALRFSAASIWEIATKHRLGKLSDAESVALAPITHARRLGAVELPVTAEHAQLAGSAPWEHQDPFDRMLAAQSILESIPLVTADRALRSLAGVQVLW